MRVDEHHLKIPPGTRLFEQGDEGDCAYIIEAGEVAISSRNEQGRDIQLAVLGAGHVVGEMALIDGGTRTARATTLTSVTLVKIPKEHFARLIDHADPTVTLLIQVVLQRYRTMKALYDRLTTGLASDGSPLGISQNEQALIHQASLAVERVVREQELLNALENNYLELYYQPISNLDSNRVVGCEALIRWIDPVQGVIPPNLFIALAEETGLIEEIGLVIFKSAFLAAQRFRERTGNRQFFVSINLSSRQIETDEQVERLFTFLDQNGISLEHIKVEITESLLMTDQVRVGSILERFKAQGAQISLDDFGTGYSSFSYLHQFPIDNIKIDQSFIFSMDTNAKSEAIVRTLCSLANSLEMSTTGEGVETLGTEVMLKSFGCHYGQGYYYSRPIPEDQFVQLLRPM